MKAIFNASMTCCELTLMSDPPPPPPPPVGNDEVPPIAGNQP